MLPWVSTLMIGITIVLLLPMVAQLIVGYRALSKMAYQITRLQVQPDLDVPDYVREAFSKAIATLISHDFQQVNYFTVEPIQDTVLWSVLLHDPARQIYAVVVFHSSQNPGESIVEITLTSLIHNEPPLVSINTQDPRFFTPCPDRRIEFYAGVGCEVLLSEHRKMLEKRSQLEPAIALTPTGYLEFVQEESVRDAEHRVQNKEAVWIEPQFSYRLSRWFALRVIIRILRQIWMKRFQRHSPRSAASIAPEKQVDLEFEAFNQQRLNQKKLSRRTKTWLFLGSMGLFASIYSLQVNFEMLIIFMVALLLHEGGHVLAMKLFGYRDTAILFIPFLGALATARKEDATLTEKVWISLAGPIPGLLLAFALGMALHLAWLPPVSWGYDAVFILVVLNFFNLLPVYPLDGGQVADLLIFSRNPYWSVAFKMFGVGLLILMALYLQTPLLCVFALAIGLGIPNSFRLAKLQRTLRNELKRSPQVLQSQTSTTEENDEAYQLFQYLQHPPYQGLAFPQKMALVKGVLEGRAENSAPWITRLGLSSVYLVSLLLGVVGSIGAIAFTVTQRSLTTVHSSQSRPQSPIQVASTPASCRTERQISVTDNAARGRQMRLMGTFPTPQKAETAWRQLEPILDKKDIGSRYGQSIFVTTANSNTESQLRAIFRSGGAPVFNEEQALEENITLRITAGAPHPTVVKQTSAELDEFFTLAPYFSHLRTPWDRPASLSPQKIAQEKNARSTYARLLEERTRASTVSDSILPTMAASLLRNRQWQQSMSRNYQAKVYQRQQRAILAIQQSGNDEFDPQVIQLFLEELQLQYRLLPLTLRQNSLAKGKSQKPEVLHHQLQKVQDKLLDRLGRRPTLVGEAVLRSEVQNWSGMVRQSGSRLELEQAAAFQTHKTLPAIATYLCEQGFSDIRYEFVTEPSNLDGLGQL